MNKKLIEEIRKHVEKECMKESQQFKVNAYETHFKAVVEYAKMMAKKTKADEEIVEIAAWLHDIGSIHGHYEDHHICGAEYAAKLLKKYNYPKEKIENVKHCILSHRGSKDIPRETKEARCLADADAMSHFTNIPGLFHLTFVTLKYDTPKAKKYLRDKLERSWKKISPEGKKIIKEKYEAAKTVLE